MSKVLQILDPKPLSNDPKYVQMRDKLAKSAENARLEVGQTDIQPQTPESGGFFSDLGSGLVETPQYQVPRAIGSTMQMGEQLVSRINPEKTYDRSNIAAGLSALFGGRQSPQPIQGENQTGYYDPKTGLLFQAGQQLRDFADVREGQIPPKDTFGYKLGAGASTIATSLIAGTVGTFLGGPVGGAVAGFGATAAMEGGLAYDKAVKYGVSPEDATGIGLSVAAINGTLGYSPIGGFLKATGLSKAISREVAGKVVEQGLLKTVLKGVSKQGFSEAWTEGAQELTNLTMETLYKKAEDDPQLAEWLSRTGESALYGFILGGLMGIVGGGMQSKQSTDIGNQALPIDPNQIGADGFTNFPELSPGPQQKQSAEGQRLPELPSNIQGEPQYRQQPLMESEKQLANRRVDLIGQIKDKRKEYNTAKNKKQKAQIRNEIIKLRNEILQFEQIPVVDVMPKQVQPKPVQKVEPKQPSKSIEQLFNEGKNVNEIIQELKVRPKEQSFVTSKFLELKKKQEEASKYIFRGVNNLSESGANVYNNNQRLINKMFDLREISRSEESTPTQKADATRKAKALAKRVPGLQFDGSKNVSILGQTLTRVSKSEKTNATDYKIQNETAEETFEKLGTEEQDKQSVLADFFGQKKYLSKELTDYIPNNFGQKAINKGIDDIKKGGGAEQSREAQITRDFLKNIESELNEKGSVTLSNGQEVTQDDFQQEFEQYVEQKGKEYGQENVEGLPSSEQGREAIEQKQPNKGTSGQEAKASGVLQAQGEVKIKKLFDNFKETNAPYEMQEVSNEYGRTYDKKVYLDEAYKDHMFKSDETNKKVRWGVELSNGKRVSLEGAIRITKPEQYKRFKKGLTAKNYSRKIWDALSEDERQSMVDQLDYGVILEGVSPDKPRDYFFDKKATDRIESNLTTYLKDIGHPLSDVLAYRGTKQASNLFWDYADKNILGNLAEVRENRINQKEPPTARGKLVDSFNKWNAGRTDSQWDQLGSIFRERLKNAKTELNRLAKNDESLSVNDKIAISKARTFGEIRAILESNNNQTRDKAKDKCAIHLDEGIDNIGHEVLGNFNKKKDAEALAQENGGKVTGYLNGKYERGWYVWRNPAISKMETTSKMEKEVSSKTPTIEKTGAGDQFTLGNEFKPSFPTKAKFEGKVDKSDETPLFNQKKEDKNQINAFGEDKPKVITDPARVQQIENSIAEGELILRTGKFNGRKFSEDELEAVRKQVAKDKAKIGNKPNKGELFQKQNQPTQKKQIDFTQEVKKVDKLLPKGWNVEIGDNTTLPVAKGKISLETKTITVNKDIADETTIPHEIAHGALSIADPVNAKRLLKLNGWDGQGETMDLENKSLVGAHEAIAEKYEQYHTDREKFEKESGRFHKLYKTVFEKLKQVFQQVSNLLKGNGLVSEAKFYDDLYRGKFADGGKQFGFVSPAYMHQKLADMGQALFQKAKPEGSINDRVHEAAKRKKEQYRKDNSKKLISAIKNLDDDYIVPMQTALKKVSPKLGRKIRFYDFKLGNKITDRLSIIKPFVQKMDEIQKTNPEDYNMIDYYLKAGKREEVMPLLRKYNLAKEYSKVRKLYDDMYGESKGVGFQLGHRYNYWARGLADIEGYVKRFKGTDAFDVFEDLFKKIEKQRKETPSWRRENKTNLTKEEKFKIMNNAIRGYYYGITLRGIANFKERLISDFTPEHNQYFEDATESLIKYVTSGTEAIESRKLFGKGDGENLDNSIAAYIESTGLTPKEAKRASDLLKARFNIMFDPDVSAYKSFVYLTTIGSGFTSTIRQLADLPMTAYNYGVINTAKAFGKAAKSGLANSELLKKYGLAPKDAKDLIKMIELGINDISAEFKTISAGDIFNRNKSTKESLQELVDRRNWEPMVRKSFDAVGFTQLDAMMKETTINAAYIDFKKKANSRNVDKLIEKVKSHLGDNKYVDGVINSFRKGQRTELTDFIVYNEILEVQPLTVSEMPKGWQETKRGKALYTLKSFSLKRLNFIRNQTTRIMFNKNLSLAKRAIGFKNLVKIYAFLGLGEAVTTTLINALMGLDNDAEEILVNSILQLYGFSKYDIDRFSGPTAVAQKILPITTPADYVYRDVSRAIEGKKARYESLKLVPLVGKPLWYWFFYNK